MHTEWLLVVLCATLPGIGLSQGGEVNRYARAAGVIGFAGSLVVGAVLFSEPPQGGQPVACAAGQHATVSKYAGSLCAPDLGKGGHQVATVVTGCWLGAPGGLSGIALGCLGGGVAAVLDVTP